MKEVYEVLGNHLRRQIITTLGQHRMLTVQELQKILGIKQSTLSNHLGLLRKLKIVDCRYAQHFRYYALNQSQVTKIINDVQNLFLFQSVDHFSVRRHQDM